MVRVRGLLKIFLVAGIASRRQSLELPDRGALMAIVALQGRVGANKGKAVFVVLNVLHRDVPAADRMALLAARSHLAPVDVRMAVGALSANIRKHRLAVALGARDVFVQATQRIRRLVVIEFRDSADRLPSQRSMAVLTRKVQISVRTPRLRRHIGARACPNCRQQRQRQRDTRQKSCPQVLPQPRGLNSDCYKL